MPSSQGCSAPFNEDQIIVSSESGQNRLFRKNFDDHLSGSSSLENNAQRMLYLIKCHTDLEKILCISLFERTGRHYPLHETKSFKVYWGANNPNPRLTITQIADECPKSSKSHISVSLLIQYTLQDSSLQTPVVRCYLARSSSP